jgi:hypothetical protein
MGGDVRIRWISNTGSEMARKAVKQWKSAMVEASKMGRADALGASERATAVEACGPSMIMEGITTFRIKPRGAGPIQMLVEGALEFCRHAKIPLLMGFSD